MILTHDEILRVLVEIQNDGNRRIQELNNHLVYEGDLKRYVQDSVRKKFPESWEGYTIANYNLVKKIVDKKSKSYTKAPVRKLDKGPETELYNQILDQFHFNDAMKLVDRYHNQFRYCGLGVIRDRKFQSDGSFVDSYSFWSLAPYNFCVHRNLEEEIYAWSIPTGKRGDYHYWTIWTVESHVKIRTKDYKDYEIIPHKNNPKNINPYGILPFVYVPVDISGSYPVTSSLPEQTIEMNTNLSIYLTSGNMQIGQLVIEHPDGKKIKTVTTGLLSGITLPQEKTNSGQSPTKAYYISPAPNLDGHKDSVLTYMMMILDEHGINSNGVIKGGEKFTSGSDRLISNADVQDIIEDNQDIYTRTENEVYKIIKSMTNKDGNLTLKSEGLKVKFSRPKVLFSDSEKLDNLKKKKDLGIWFDWELIMEADPNLTEEEAKEKALLLKGGTRPEPLAITESEEV